LIFFIFISEGIAGRSVSDVIMPCSDLIV